ncbi:MAG: nickel pincer cofactor biosynthesis protein LarB [Oscillospiraceae bacterium]|nr:nickel pincer cofactor biosynthesis protein LarB [Oscillospiraceae bacterium]
MDKQEITALLESVAAGAISVEEAVLKLKTAPIRELEGYAKVDLHRGLRQGVPEVIYGAGKAPEHILGIAKAMREAGQETVLVTRLTPEAAALLETELPLRYDPRSKTGVIGRLPEPTGKGTVVVATGGTSDIPVAEEAAVTAEALGNRVTRLYDVGVSGIHRLLSHVDEIMSARVIVAVAGMEGALPSVIGGLADCPVIAVPTSVGYGASLGGVAALLSMLNSCASGVAVVNIDNGFGAGFMASVINHLE